MKCPMCGKGEVTCVGPWCAYPGMFGLGFNMADGRTCCSFNDRRRFATEAEAQTLADSKSIEKWAADEGLACDEEDLIGDQGDGDPYDKEPGQW